MTAKDEHARNVDMHKMRRQHTELTKQNAALEMECAGLKIATKDAFDKCSTMREAMTKQCTDKMNEMKAEFENEKKRWNEQAQKDASFQRAQHMETFNDIKRQLESIYANKMQEQNAAHEAVMQQLKTKSAALNDECERKRREMGEQLAQLAQDRRQVNAELEAVRQQAKRELDELSARIKRDEQANIIRLVMEMDSERAKMKCQLEEERDKLVEQLDKECIQMRQNNDNEIAEMKKQAECEINDRMKELEAELQRLKMQQDIVQQKEESICALQKIAEERMNERFDEERDKMKCQLEKERQHIQNEAAAERRTNAQLLEKASQELEHKFKARVAENDAQHKLMMQKMHKEQEQIKQRACELAQQKEENDAKFSATVGQHRVAFDATIRKLNEEREAVKETGLRREQECEANAEALAKDFNLAMQKLNEEREAVKETGLRREQDLGHKFNLAMQKLNEEREAVKETGLRREQEHAHLMREMNLERASNVKEFNKANEEMAKERANLAKERANLAKERAIVLEEKRLVNEERIILVKEHDDIKRERQCQTGLMQRLTNEVEQLNIQLRQEQEKHVQMQNHLNQCLETDNPLSKQLHDAVAANSAHLQLISSLDFKDKRVAIYSHYSGFDEVESYNVLTIEYIQHYFDYIIILTNCPNKWNMHSPNHNKMHLLNYNMKSDFRNYGVFIMQTELNLINASCVCFINDSFVVVDVNAFGQCIKRVFDLSHDFIGMTSSHENVFHLQSFFLHFNAPTLKHVMNYFKEQGLPNNHDGAISKYELGISIHLMNHGFSQFAFVSNDDMKVPLNTTCVKWAEVLNETGIIKRQHFFKKYAYKSMSDSDISEVAEKYAYNKHFVNFLKYNNIKIRMDL